MNLDCCPETFYVIKRDHSVRNLGSVYQRADRNTPCYTPELSEARLFSTQHDALMWIALNGRVNKDERTFCGDRLSIVKVQKVRQVVVNYELQEV